MYPMGSQPPPGGQHGQFGQGAGWHQGPPHGGHGHHPPQHQGPPHGAHGHPPPQHHGHFGQHYQGIGHGHPPPPHSEFYGNYGQTFQQNVFQVNAAQALGYGSQNDLQMLFDSKKSQRYNAIQAQELCQILNESPNMRNYYRINWSLELCKIMIGMLDRSHDGMMQYTEFCELLQCLTYWHQCFCQYDHDRSGYIESSELGRVIRERLSYSLTQAAMTTVLKRYSRAMDDGRLLIAFDDFVSLCVRLRAYTEAFRARDRQMNGGHETGRTMFSYDDFLQCVMYL